MPTETTTATAATAVLETPARDWSQLDALIGEEPPETPETPPTPPTETPAVPTGTPETPATPPADDALKNLDTLIAETTDKPDEAKPSTPPSSPEVETVQYWTQDPQRAAQAVGYVKQMVDLIGEADAGDFDKVLNHFAPQFNKGLVDHLFNKHKQEFAQRFIDEIEGKSSDPRLTALQSEVSQLKTTLTAREQREQQAAQQQSQAARHKAFNEYFDRLFAAVNVTDPKRQRLLRGATMDALSADPKAAANIRAGRFGAIGPKFKEIYQESFNDWKSADTATAQVRAAQETNKTGQLATGSTAATESAEEPLFDGEGKRTEAFWKKGLKKIGLSK